MRIYIYICIFMSVYIFMYIFMHIYIYTELRDAPQRPLVTLCQIMWRWRGAEEQAGAGAVLKNQAAHTLVA